MKTAHIVITLLLALAFLISGLSKASGSNAGLSGTRDLGFPDGPARLVGIFEVLASVSLVIGFAFDNATLEQYGYVAILAIMAGAVFFHFRANKMRTAFPAMLFLVLATIGIFSSKL
ncbi:MAG: DoxX family membrane protein [Actinobacteria bacterium]|jgi:uncharacterized membrane protein YphA (DoxX/SURF4 family)|nr:DoxX family membrane protein [Actinomycetota bacterium]